MKKGLSLIGVISIVLVFGLTVIGCGGGGGSPSSVAKQFYTAVEKGDTKAFSDLMTPESAQMMTMFAEKAKGTVAEQGKITKTEETINGDKATVKFTFENGSTEELSLVKVDGKWKVSMDK